MKEAVRTLIHSPGAFVIVILLLLLALLFTVKATSNSGEVVNNIEHSKSLTQVEYSKSR